MNEAKNHAEALNIVFDSAKYATKVIDILDAFGKRFSAFGHRTFANLLYSRSEFFGACTY